MPITLGVMFLLNSNGLAMTGLEHSLQVLLTTVIATQLLSSQRQACLWWALVVLPWVRYEGLAISAPVWLALWWESRSTQSGSQPSFNSAARPVLLGVALSAAGLLGFSAFLQSLGLGWLPSSVVAKTGALLTQDDGLPGKVLGIAANMMSNATRPDAMIISAALAFLTWRLKQQEKISSPWLILIWGPWVLHLILGRFGWFGRYQAYILTYVTLIAIALLSRISGLKRVHWILAWLIFATCTYPMWKCTLLTPWASKNIHDQQLQMAIIASKYLDQGVAVNDLGEVALRTNKPVLDLWGLGSFSALKARREDPSGHWIGPMMRRYGIRFAFVYESWFPNRPSEWHAVAKLVLNDRAVSAGDAVVTLFATDETGVQELTQALKNYTAHEPAARSVQVQWVTPPTL